MNVERVIRVPEQCAAEIATHYMGVAYQWRGGPMAEMVRSWFAEQRWDVLQELFEYLAHDVRCVQHILPPMKQGIGVGPCDCGLNDAIAAIPELPGAYVQEPMV